MNYNEMRSVFLDILNRTDATNIDADKFLYLGTTRVERRLRTFLQRFEVDLSVNPNGTFTIPHNLLSIIKVEDHHGIIPRVSQLKGCPRGYIIGTSGLKTTSKVTSLKITYYAEFDKSMPVDDSDDISRQSSVIPDVIIYAALVFSADKFEDERAIKWEATFEKLLKEVQDMADELELSGHPAIRNPYEGFI